MTASLVQTTHRPPIMYFANPARDAIPIMRQGGHLGFISTPKQGNKIPSGAFWIADNGMGPGKAGVIRNGHGKGAVTDDLLLRWLASYSDEERDRCLFAVAPTWSATQQRRLGGRRRSSRRSGRLASRSPTSSRTA